jgi:NADH:ubiquinone oxidoreductase subunit 2 (subunit N)
MTMLLNLTPTLTKYSSLGLLLSNYMVLTAASVIIFSAFRWLTLKNIDNSNNEYVAAKLFTVLFFLNLAGIPPLPGFFIKLNLLLFLINYINIYTAIIIILFNFTIFYFYIQFYKNTIVYTRNKTQNLRINIINIIITLLILLNFIPIHNLLTLFIL